ncbi:cytochrome D1 domain-containing protein [Candidatus Magnetaquicoccus inordinatus]|uniref:cytochrome D1 domain-containing protein n=1 Tax=Candidatus Magnetaquicoccus inordinatus TaxID=2496818 RepID=UPI00102C4670|nr:cytochrome D1 domain-containing protein [Candidatus Magnetaquicoccus inordinatus]
MRDSGQLWRKMTLCSMGLLAILLGSSCTPLRGTGDLGVVVERADGSLQVLENSHNSLLASVPGLGDLSHATALFSRDGRYAYICGRDGGLSKVDLLTYQVVNRVIQSGNSIGGAISQDGRWLAVANYTPGGVRIFDTETLEMKLDLPAMGADGKLSKVVGLEDAPGQAFVFSLFEAGEIWMVDVSDIAQAKVHKWTNAGAQPYDGLVTPDGHYYVAGLFGEDGMTLLDLWNPEKGIRRILQGYGRGQEKLPVYKMPHLEGWAVAGTQIFLPAVGHHEVIVADMQTWKEVAHIPVHSQPVFAMARPDGRQVWVNFAHPDNDTIQVIDVPSLKVIKQFRPGKGVMHMEFTPKGEEVWISLRDENRVEVYRTDNFSRVATLPAKSPSGIFFSSRAHKIGL